GYRVDRTPYGVVLHEVGHHWHLTFRRPRVLAREFRDATRGEDPVTSYAPNVGEDVAEAFKLFSSNPDLMRLVRPLRFRFLADRIRPVEMRPWREVLAGSPRHLATAERQVDRARHRLDNRPLGAYD
ncbi:MAG: hypothetical protein L0323_19045, partial [Planctomycetes bacterium]|nr:hypothetical protein [Planctomycetota bacterium]